MCHVKETQSDEGHQDSRGHREGVESVSSRCNTETVNILEVGIVIGLPGENGNVEEGAEKAIVRS